MTKIIIGITGKAGSGKDTLAQNLINNGYIKLSFGSALKDIVSIITGWSRDFVDGTNDERHLRETLKHPDYNKTCRELMQIIGTDLFRNQLADNIWVNIIKNKIESDKTNNKFVITDIRFNNEAHMIKSMGGHIIQIIRDNNQIISSHISENGIVQDIDYIIENNGSKDELYDKLNNFITNIEIKYK
jgi:dephospho-CoA kinase